MISPVPPPDTAGIRLSAAFALCSLLVLSVLGLLMQLEGGVETAMLVALRRGVDHPGAGWRVLHEVMDTATALGSFPALVIVLAGLVGYFRCIGRGGVAVRLLVLSAVGMAIGEAVKLGVGRARPQVVPHWQAVGSFSFPSGHTTDGTVVYLLLALVAASAAPTASSRRFVLYFALALVMLIGCSRMYLGVHWPTDVLGGWTLGACWAWLVATKSWLVAPVSSGSTAEIAGERLR